jgi:lipopolysaccharide/colanic/teichoic acid biosynthesis glycosyltransferase
MTRFTLSDVLVEPLYPRRVRGLSTVVLERPGRRRPVHRSTPATSRGPTLDRALRRGLDVGIALAALTLLAPVFVFVALAIKATSPGPVFYRQTRVGRNMRRGQRRADASTGPRDRRRLDRRCQGAHGRPFQILKFRTMRMNAEEYGPQWSTPDDPRITSVGRFLRKTRIDETPQFWNVLRGEMSVVGPRPERPYFVDQFVECIPGYSQRLHVRPGITGLAQVTLDYDSSIDDVKLKLERDLEHVQKRSLSKDLAILARTGYVVLTGKGAL